MKKDKLSDRVSPAARYRNGDAHINIRLKQVLQLTAIIFLMTAPALDPNDIVGISAQFIVPANP